MSVVFSATLQAKDRDTINYLTKSDTLIMNHEKVVIPRRVFIPDHARLQFAGNIGFLSVGLGYNFGKSYELTVMYGIQNEFFGNSKETVKTLALKNTFNLYNSFHIYKNISFIPTAGLSINWGFTNNTFRKLPKHYPNKYYFQNRVHFAPFIGGKIRYDFGKTDKSEFTKHVELYVEAGSLDAYILEWVRTDYVKIGDIMSLAVGISFYYK
jgi:hypothetical protein